MPPPKQLSKPHSKASIVVASLLFLVWCLMVKVMSFMSVTCFSSSAAGLIGSPIVNFFELIIEILHYFLSCSKKICLSHKRKVAFGGVEPVSQPPWRSEQTGTSTAFALPGPEGSKSVQKGVTENALVFGPTLQPKLFQVLLTFAVYSSSVFDSCLIIIFTAHPGALGLGYWSINCALALEKESMSCKETVGLDA